MDIVVTGYAGLAGSIAVYNDPSCRAKLTERYSAGFLGVLDAAAGLSEDSEELRKKEELDRLYSLYAEQGLAADGGSGGVLSALWRVLKSLRSGGRYSQRSIPIMQQTVEICEMFSLNPYRLYAPDCRVWLCEDTGVLADAAASAEVPLNVIGFTSKGAAIKRTDTEFDSSLRRPEGDELAKIINPIQER